MNTTTEDTALVRRLQKGDIDAFDLIYGKYSVKLYSFGLKYLKSEAESEELVQSVFLKLWENHRQLKAEFSFKSYLFTIAYNDMCKLFRQRNYMQKFIQDSILNNAQTTNDTEEGINYQSVIHHIESIVERLPQRQKEIFLKKWHEGKSTKEIAEELSLSSGTVDNYVSESLRFIRKRVRPGDLASLLFIYLFLL